MLGTRQRFRELRTTWACGKVRSLLGASFQKQKVVCCAAGFGAAPRLPTAALTQTKFRKRLKHVERGDHVEKLSAIL